jgi:hypothetical protein
LCGEHELHIASRRRIAVAISLESVAMARCRRCSSSLFLFVLALVFLSSVNLSIRECAAEIESGDGGDAEVFDEDKDDDVVVLGADNFTEFLNTNPYVLVEFYAPSVGSLSVLGSRVSVGCLNSQGKRASCQGRCHRARRACQGVWSPELPYHSVLHRRSSKALHRRASEVWHLEKARCF